MARPPPSPGRALAGPAHALSSRHDSVGVTVTFDFDPTSEPPSNRYSTVGEYARRNKYATPSSIEALAWDELNPHQRLAARMLGFGEVSWNDRARRSASDWRAPSWDDHPDTGSLAALGWSKNAWDNRFKWDRNKLPPATTREEVADPLELRRFFAKGGSAYFDATTFTISNIPSNSIEATVITEMVASEGMRPFLRALTSEEVPNDPFSKDVNGGWGRSRREYGFRTPTPGWDTIWTFFQESFPAIFVGEVFSW